MSLRTLREQQGMTVEQVAQALGLSVRHVHRLESGETGVRRIHLLALGVVYGLPVEKVEKAVGGGKA